jgi:hypothetical protein
MGQNKSTGKMIQNPMNPKIKLPVAWQKFGKEWCLTGQHGMRPIYLSVGGRPTRTLQLLNHETGLLVPFTPDHPHAQQIAHDLNHHDKLVAALGRIESELSQPVRTGSAMTDAEVVKLIRETLASNGEGKV